MIDEKKLIMKLRKFIDKYGDFGDILKEIIKEIEYQPKVGEWIPCKDGKNMPPERDSVFADFKGTDKWNDAMFEKISDDVEVTLEYPDGKRIVDHIHTTDGKWKRRGFFSCEVIAWKPMGEPYKEGAEV